MVIQYQACIFLPQPTLSMQSFMYLKSFLTKGMKIWGLNYFFLVPVLFSPFYPRNCPLFLSDAFRNFKAQSNLDKGLFFVFSRIKVYINPKL